MPDYAMLQGFYARRHREARTVPYKKSYLVLCASKREAKRELCRPRIARDRDLPESGGRADRVNSWPKIAVEHHVVPPVQGVEHLAGCFEAHPVAQPETPAEAGRDAEQVVAGPGVSREVVAVDDRPSGRPLNGVHARRDIQRER